MCGMPNPDDARFGWRSLDDLTIDDEPSFRHVQLYADLKASLRRDDYAFRTLPERGATWDRALFLNLAFWGANEGGDVLVDEHIPADVVAHVAWHRLAAKALTPDASARPPVEALFLGEAIASAFDLYLVGRLLGHAPRSEFLATQVPAMAEAAAGAGVSDDEFDTMLHELSEDPERGFALLRELLVDVTAALFESKRAEDALDVLDRFATHRYGALLHRYELANWILYARAYGDPAPAPRVHAVERALRSVDDPLAWLDRTWVQAALT